MLPTILHLVEANNNESLRVKVPEILNVGGGKYDSLQYSTLRE